MTTKRAAAFPAEWRAVKHAATRQAQADPAELPQLRQKDKAEGDKQEPPATHSGYGLNQANGDCNGHRTLHGTSSAPAEMGTGTAVNTPPQLAHAQSVQPKAKNGGKQSRAAKQQQVPGQQSMLQSLTRPGGRPGGSTVLTAPQGLQSPAVLQSQQTPTTATPSRLPTEPFTAPPVAVGALPRPLLPCQGQQDQSLEQTSARPPLQLSEQQLAAAQADIHAPLAVVAGEVLLRFTCSGVCICTGRALKLLFSPAYGRILSCQVVRCNRLPCTDMSCSMYKSWNWQDDHARGTRPAHAAAAGVQRPSQLFHLQPSSSNACTMHVHQMVVWPSAQALAAAFMQLGSK